MTSSGKVYIKKPGHLRWDYLDPATEQIYVNQEDVKVYVPEHKQVLVGKLTQMAASKAPLELLQGAAKLDESFEIEPTRGRDRGVGGMPLITLIPKAKEQESTQNLQKIVVEVFPKTYFIRTVSLHEVSGNVAIFEFSNLKPNLGLGNEIFDFKTPADAGGRPGSGIEWAVGHATTVSYVKGQVSNRGRRVTVLGWMLHGWHLNSRNGVRHDS